MGKRRIIVTEEELIDLVMKSIFNAGVDSEDKTNKSGNKWDNQIIPNDLSTMTTGSTDVSDSEYREKVIKLLANYEGFRPKAYPDAGRYAIGFGSTYIDGVPVKAGDTITREKALAQKSKDIDKFKNVILRQVGQSTWDNLDLDTRVVLTSIAYNYGSIPSRLIDAVKSGDKKQIHDIIKNNLSRDNAGVNDWRRKDEAMVLATGQSGREPSYDV